MFHAAQVLGQRLPAWGLGRLLGRSGRRLGQSRLQRGELCLQVRLVLDQRVQEQLPLLRVHRLGARAELPPLEPRQLEGDLLDLGVPPHDLARLLLHAHQQVLRQTLEGFWRQPLQVLTLERVDAMHAPMLPAGDVPRHPQLQQLRARHPLTPA